MGLMGLIFCPYSKGIIPSVPSVEPGIQYYFLKV